MTSKGQTTIPKEIRDQLGLRAGDRLAFTLLPDGTVLRRVSVQDKNFNQLNSSINFQKTGWMGTPTQGFEEQFEGPMKSVLTMRFLMVG